MTVVVIFSGKLGLNRVLFSVGTILAQEIRIPLYVKLEPSGTTVLANIMTIKIR